MFANSRDFLNIVFRQFVEKPGRVVLGGTMLVISAAALTILPVMASKAIEQWSRSQPQNWTLVNEASIWLVGTFLLWLISSSINGYIQEESNQRAVMHSRLQMCRRWLSRAPGADDARYGMVTRMTSDAQAFERALAAFSHHVPLAFLQIIGALTFMIVVAPLLGVAFIVCLFVVAGILSIAERHLVLLSHSVNEAAAATMFRSVELLTHNRLIRRFRQEDAECTRVEEAQSRLLYALDKRRRSQIVARAVVFLMLALSIIGIAFLGLVRVRSGASVPGDLVAFVGLAMIIGTSVTSLTDSLATISGGIEPLRRLTEKFVVPKPSDTHNTLGSREVPQ